MVDEASDDERRWAADKREFVADCRDEVAGERDAIAEAREKLADARELELDEWESQLQARATRVGSLSDPSSAARRAEQHAEQDRARAVRDEARHGRERAGLERDEATKRRLAGGRPTLLAQAFAEIAEHLYDAETFEEVLQKITEAAVATVAGCRMASVTLRERDDYRTAASTGPVATEVDRAQYEANEGPCLDAFSQPLVYAPSFPDVRWPVLAGGPIESGVQSALSIRLATSARQGSEPGAGSLNSYGLQEDAFDDAAKEIGLILAAHASVAARAVGERSALMDLGVTLQAALLSRDVIGQAKGILMERLRITPEAAFDVLRNSSQRLNIKLREVARKLTETGELVNPQDPDHPDRRR